MYSIVGFPTRINNCSSTAIDNIFIDKNKNTAFTINQFPSGLSDHDAQILILHNINNRNSKAYRPTKGLINYSTISEFKWNLSYESWDTIFIEDNVDSVFNNFQDTYLRIFYHSFPLKKAYHNYNKKAWITTGIKISSQHKRDLYLIYRSTHDSNLKNYYRTYCRVLSEVIKTAKKLHYNKHIIKPGNKGKIVWDIVNMETNKKK